jgi:hypothetical protein
VRLIVKVLIGGVIAVAVGNALGKAVPISPPKLNQQEKAQLAQNAAVEQTHANASHCLGWDGSVDRLKQAVRDNLRNPSSFEHVRTAISPIGKDGKFAAVMTYRAQNGFGGMNVENVGAIVDPESCDFQLADADQLIGRIGK